MAREIVFDTETTGLDPAQGHRLIEIGLIEIEDLLPTGRSLHRRLRPDRTIDPDAVRIHGITDAMVADAPRFHELADEILDFIGEAPLVAHNAAFDRGFLNAELTRCGREPFGDHRFVDTLILAQQRFPGMYNSLDALCKRFRIALTEREKHGALVDARLLAQVYLELKGGKERGLELAVAQAAAGAVVQIRHGPRPRPLPLQSTPQERERHAAFIEAAFKGGALWLRLAPSEA